MKKGSITLDKKLLILNYQLTRENERANLFAWLEGYKIQGSEPEYWAFVIPKEKYEKKKKGII